MKTLGKLIYEQLKRKYDNAKSRQNQKRFHYQIEIDCGEVVNIKGMKQSELVNKINTGYFDFKTLLFYLFFKQFERIGVLIYYLVMIVHFCTLQINQEDLVMYILPLSMHYVLQIAKAFYFDYQKMEYDKKTNNREVTRYRRLRKDINSGNKPQIVTVQTENQLISKEPQVVISKVEIQKKPHSVQSGRKKEKLQLYENIQWYNSCSKDFARRYKCIGVLIIIMIWKYLQIMLLKKRVSWIYHYFNQSIWKQYYFTPLGNLLCKHYNSQKQGIQFIQKEMKFVLQTYQQLMYRMILLEFQHNNWTVRLKRMEGNQHNQQCQKMVNTKHRVLITKRY